MGGARKAKPVAAPARKAIRAKKAVPNRNPLLSKIHIAKKDLALSEEAYRDLL